MSGPMYIKKKQNNYFEENQKFSCHYWFTQHHISYYKSTILYPQFRSPKAQNTESFEPAYVRRFTEYFP